MKTNFALDCIVKSAAETLEGEINSRKKETERGKKEKSKKQVARG